MRERRRRLVLLGDVGTAYVAAAAAWLLAPPGTRPGALVALTIATLAWPIVLAVRGLYAVEVHRTRGETSQVLHSLVVFLALLAVGGAFFGRDVSNLSFASASIVLMAGSVGARWLADRHVRGLGKYGLGVSRTLAVGPAAEVTALVDRLADGTDHPFVVVGACAEGDGDVVEDIPTLARVEQPHEADRAEGDPLVDAVVAALGEVAVDTVCVVPGSALSGARLRALSWALAERDVALTTALGVVDVAAHRLRLAQAGSATLVDVRPNEANPARGIVKAAIDRVAAAVGLIILVPVFFVLALAVRASGRGPVIYRQRRIGKRGGSFTMLKFRTMSDDADERRDELAEANDLDGPMFKMREDPRITRVGRWLRRTSLDELPQLVNVLRGEMSLVGPRPPLPDEVAEYSRLELRRLRVTPGMTGLWQVSGRSNLTWEDTVRLDLQYVDNWTLADDARLLGRTAGAVVRGTGAY